jgi:hypothetical protein
MIIRRASEVALLLVGLGGCVILFGYRASIEHTVTNSLEIDHEFRSAGASIRRFEVLQHRQPSAKEASELFTSAAQGRYELNLSSDTSICDQNSAAYRTLKAAPYVVWTWRGEWAECFSPTLAASTLITSSEEYALLGSVGRDEGALGVLILLCFGSSGWLWRKRPARLG